MVSGNLHLPGALIAGILAFACQASAESLTVTTAVDEDDGSPNELLGTGTSLREAIIALPTGGTIFFSPTLDGETITLTLGQLVVGKEISIDASALPAGIRISGGRHENSGQIEVVDSGSRVFHVSAPGTLNLHSVTIADGFTLGSNENDGSFDDPDPIDYNVYGAGIFVSGGTVTMTNCTVRDCQAVDSGNGQESRGGGIAVILGGTLTATNTSFLNNSPHFSHPFFGSTAKGGALYASDGTTVTLNSCTLAGNDGLIGGALANEGTMTLTNCTISGNRSLSAGVVFTAEDLTVIHCTIAGNELTANVQPWLGTAAGISMSGGTSAVMTIENSIVAGNISTEANPPTQDIGHQNSIVYVHGQNLIGSNYSVSSIFPTDGILVGNETDPIDPLLGPLGNNGGPTPTMALLEGSQAIDAAVESTLAIDQRGVARTGQADLGAFESGHSPPPPPLTRFGRWAAENIAEGLDRSFAGDANGDGTPNGIEFAIGANPTLPSRSASLLPRLLLMDRGQSVDITFGYNPEAAASTIWILKRSADLKNFFEIYRYTGPTRTATTGAGVSALAPTSNFVVRDTNPPLPNGFYVLQAMQADP